MKLEAIARPITYRWPGGEIRLEPGQPVELPDERARRLLTRAAGHVRPVTSDLTVAPASQLSVSEAPNVVVEPAIQPAPLTGRLITVHWEAVTGQIKGPAVVVALARVRESGGRETFWVCVDWEGLARWVREDRLRSRAQFEAAQAQAAAVLAVPAAPFPIGARVTFDGGLGFPEIGVIEAVTDWTQYPGEVCYAIRTEQGAPLRTVPQSRIRGREEGAEHA